MRTSQYLLSTLKQVPANVESISYQLMLRSGMIRKLTSGLYTWMPIGLRVLRKVENIVRTEMNNSGAIEILMPVVQPASLWKESGRLEQYGSELFHCIDRSKHLFVLGPTHEEVITHLIRSELHSYKQLPLNFYQIHTKFRDEIRPCFGIIRSREFLMKDAYSFHISQKSLQDTYDKMYKTYNKIFTRIGLNFYIIKGDSDFIGGSVSHEFRILLQSTKDDLTLSNNLNYSVENIQSNEIPISNMLSAWTIDKMKLVDTPNVKNITDLIKQFNLPIEKIVKTFLVKTVKESKYPFCALLIRGDHEINISKVEKIPQVASPLTFANEIEIRNIFNTRSDSLGPIKMPIPIIIDNAVAEMSNFVAVANIDEKQYFCINWNRDIIIPKVADICNISFQKKIDCNININKENIIKNEKSIEIGHIFQLGKRYSQMMNAIVQGKNGYNQILIMGCYGIGITRVVAAIIEQNHDDHGITWPDNIAPFQVVILPINMYKSYRTREMAEEIYNELHAHNIDVLMDDRQKCPGVIFNDMELIGIPHTIIISDRNLNNNNIEYKYRRNRTKIHLIKKKEIIDFLINSLKT